MLLLKHSSKSEGGDVGGPSSLGTVLLMSKLFAMKPPCYKRDLKKVSVLLKITQFMFLDS